MKRLYGQMGMYLVLCSNAKRSGGEALLTHLNLTDCFNEIIFDADKPHSMKPEDMLFIGDQGYYDLYAGKCYGARTMLVSPYDIEGQGLWDMRRYTVEDLKEFLKTI